jgi:hypothetical protein
VAGVVAVYASLFGIGKVVFGELGSGFLMLGIAAVAFAWIARSFRNEQGAPEPLAPPPPPERAYAAGD